MRLIDADTLIDWIRNDSGDKLMDSLYIDHINEMQTAYDVENVVEKLEEAIADTTDTETGLGARWAYTGAIEIVKQGGVGTDDDVCEWKYPKEIMDNTEFEVSCNSNPLKKGVVPNNFSFCDFKYCPYCGKKIKVVE